MKTLFSSDRGRTKLELVAETDKERALLSDLFMPTRIERKKGIRVKFTTLKNTPNNPNEIRSACIEKVETLSGLKLKELGFHSLYVLSPSQKLRDKCERFYRRGTTIIRLGTMSTVYKNVAGVSFYADPSDPTILGFNLTSEAGSEIERYTTNSMAGLESILEQ